MMLAYLYIKTIRFYKADNNMIDDKQGVESSLASFNFIPERRRLRLG